LLCSAEGDQQRSRRAGVAGTLGSTPSAAALLLPLQKLDEYGVSLLLCEVCEGGTFAIYDTALDLGPQRKLKPQTTTVIAVVGQAIDVKLVDF
jgi:hypothetical protein